MPEAVATPTAALPSAARGAGALAAWDRLASVRRRPRRMLAEAPTWNDLYFSPELTPVVRHPRVAALGEEQVRALLARRLYHYLDVTTWVEQSLVNERLVELFQGRTGVRLPGAMELDAYKIYCDEGYHALFSADLKDQVARASGIPAPPAPRPHVLARLDGLLETVAPNTRELARLFFVVVYETLISGILAQVPRDRRVVEPVRQVIQDHAEDEGRHHAFFSEVFRVLWPGLEPEQRDAVGPLLAPAIVAALEPDVQASDAMLASTPLDAEARRQVLADSFPADAVLRGIRGGAAATVNLLRRHGGLDHAPTRAALAATGLLPPTPDTLQEHLA